MTVGLVVETSTSAQIVFCDSDHCLSVVGRAVLTCSLAPPNPDYLGAWLKCVAQLKPTAKQPVFVLNLIDAIASPPSEEARLQIKEVLMTYGDGIAAVAYAVEGQGFAGAAIRAVLSLLNLGARYPFPQKTFGDLQDAAAWGVSQMPVGVGHQGLVPAIGEACEQMRAQLAKNGIRIGVSA